MQQDIEPLYDVKDICRLFRYNSTAAVYLAVRERRFPVPPTIGGTGDGSKRKMLWAPGPINYFLEHGEAPPAYVRSVEQRRRVRK